MKKRLLSLALCLVMVFTLLPFGASAEVYPITSETETVDVHFYEADGSTEIVKQTLVKQNSTDTLEDGALFDPGCTVSDFQVFLGWSYVDVNGNTVSSKTVNGKTVYLTVDDVLDYVRDNWSVLKTREDGLKVTAFMSEMHYISYYDEQNRILKTQTVVKELNNGTWNTTVDYDYTPYENNEDFFGWATAPNAATANYQNGTAIELTQNELPLYPVVKKGFWVTFFENDDPWNGNNIHASYTPPVFVLKGGDLNNLASEHAVAADGYVFDGWYDNKNPGEGTRIDSITDIQADQPLYAHWTARSGISYKVAYWWENANDEGYSLADKVGNQEAVVTRSGTAGADATYDSRTYQGFTLNQAKTDEAATTIAGDGTTVRNVYYTRTNYTIQFYRYQSSGWSGRWNVIPALTITAKYGADIHNMWPSLRYPDSGYSSTWVADSPNSGSNANSCDTMPLNGRNYYDNVETGRYTLEKNYYLDPIDNGLPVYSAYYSNASSRSSSGATVDSSDFPAITGFTAVSNVGQNSAQVIDRNGNTATVRFFKDGDRYATSGYTVYANFHYTRNSYTLTFDANGGEAVGSSSIKYEAPLSGYSPTNYVAGETVQTIGNKPMIFLGWYDNSAFAGNPYDFSTQTMPAKNVTLYAKWGKIQHRVEMDAAPGTFTTNDGPTNLLRFKIEDGQKILPNIPTREGYSLIGWWYKDKDSGTLSQRFNLDVTSIVSGALNDPNYTESDKSVLGRLLLGAKWRKTMDPSQYIMVEYDANGGTNAPTDDRHYSDAAEAIAQHASTPPVDPNGGRTTFVEWEVMNKDKTAVVATVKPGDSFEVLYDAAVQNGNVYTVTLRAKYALAQLTHVTWVGNGGTTNGGAAFVNSESAAMNAAISIESANTFDYPGHKFLGWAKLDEYNASLAPDGVHYTTENGWDLRPNLSESDLWLKWDEDNNQWIINNDKISANNGKAALDVAANEIQPYNVLYAVWEKYENATIIADFNAPMVIADNATKLVQPKDATHGTFTLDTDANEVTYQLKDVDLSRANTADGVNLVMNGVDTAELKGRAVTLDKNAWTKVSVVPSSTVYFDDNLNSVTLTNVDGSGYNAAVENMTNGTADGSSKEQLTFKFVGTGIDVYCTTPNANGWIQATVDGNNKQPYTNTKFDDNNAPLYNIPVVSFRDLAAGVEHTLVITTLTGANFSVDGIRVYNAMAGSEDENVAAAYKAANEENAVFMKIRDYLLANGFGENEGDDAFVGAVFTDKYGATTDVAEYRRGGPKNEVYLNADQGVAFTINNWSSYADKSKVMVALSVPTGGSAAVAASGRTGNAKIQVKAITHMYYEITPDESGNVYILNTGNSMVSVADLKITGPDAYTVSRNLTLGAPVAADETGGMLKASPKMLMSYVRSFDPDAVIEEPMPDDPDPTEQLSIRDLVRQMLSEFVSRLFGSIGHLFGH